MDFYFKGSLFGWVIKDKQSRYVYANHLACEYFNVPYEQFIGRTDKELVPGIEEYYNSILASDKKVITENSMSTVLKVFDYGSESRLKAYLVEKRPWLFEDDSVGVICTYTELSNVYFSSFLSHCHRRPLVFTQPSSLFTEREWEIMLLLFCGLKRDAIADILSINRLTLRNRITLCCEKADVPNVPHLLAYLKEKGWDNYIPPLFLQKQFITLI